MSNMSYCRFRNTLNDLNDCNDNLYESCSEDEHKARKSLIKMCRQISGYFSDDTDEFKEELNTMDVEQQS